MQGTRSHVKQRFTAPPPRLHVMAVIGGIGFLMPIYATVAHRVLPFFVPTPHRCNSTSRLSNELNRTGFFTLF